MVVLFAFTMDHNMRNSYDTRTEEMPGILGTCVCSNGICALAIESTNLTGSIMDGPW